jgi:gliding motility-associated-like protein
MKTNFLIIILATLFAKTNSYAQGSLSSGIVMYLPFNGNTLDVSGNGFHAINTGATPTTGISGLPNTAYFFNGSSHMVVKHHIDLNPRKFSICAKVKVEGWYSGFCYNNIILTKGLQRTPGFYSLQHTQTQIWSCSYEDINKHNYRLDVQNISTPLATMETLPYLIKDRWDCIVGTFDGDTAKMYVNGSLRFKYYEPGFSSNTADIFIGKMNAVGYDFYFTGSMDEIRVYNRALTATEVSNYCGFTAPANTIVANLKDTNTSCLTKQFTDLSTISSTAIKFWTWDFGDGAKSNLKNPLHNYTAPGNYTVKLLVIDSNGYSDSISKLISVGNYKFLKLSNDTTICTQLRGTSIPLFASGGVTYSWSPSAGLNDTTIANPIATISSTSTYIVTATDASGCIDKDTITITLKSGLVNVVATPKNITGCLGTIAQLNATGTKYYLWQPSAGLDDDKISNPKITISGINSYVVIGTDSNGCADIDTVTITSFPLPKLKVSSDNSSVDCNEKAVELTATGALSYRWTPAIYCETPNTSNTKVRPPATTVFTVKGTNGNGCEAVDTITVFYEGKTVVKVPNAFTPNGDGINEKLNPIIVCDFAMTEFSIYNRWGNKVFTSANINIAWDGKQNGSPCDVGIYYYYIKGKNSKGEDVLLKGDITLLR